MPLFDDVQKVNGVAGQDVADAHVADAHEAEAHVADAHAAGEHAVDPMAYYMDPKQLFGHVQDSDSFHVPTFLGEHWHIPNPLGYTKEHPMIGTAERPIFVGQMTKFMVLELVSAILIAVVFIWLARKIKSGEKPQGLVWNFLETFVVYIRNEIARPTIGKADADRYLGFLFTIFFFVLALNLFGMIPFMGSATGSLAVTGILALVTFVIVVGTGMQKMGVVGFWKAQVPHMDLPKPLAVVLIPGIWAIEVFGLFVKHFVLAIRLFANMFAGHLVLSVFLAFIGATAGTSLYYFVGPAVVLGSVAFSMLELFVAFLQAYLFTFLASLFIGSAIHPH